MELLTDFLEDCERKGMKSIGDVIQFLNQRYHQEYRLFTADQHAQFWENNRVVQDVRRIIEAEKGGSSATVLILALNLVLESRNRALGNDR